MHESVMAWVTTKVQTHDLSGRSVLEVGSFDVNGSVRPLFSGAYCGVDLREGPGVDKVMDAHRLEFDDQSFDVVICTEMLEHAGRPWLCIAEMARVLRGHLLLTCRGYDERGCWEVHPEPVDLWRFSADSLWLMCEDAGLWVLDVERDPEGPGWFVEAVR